MNLDIMAVLQVLMIPLAAFLYGLYRNMKKDYQAKLSKLELQVEQLELVSVKNSESFTRVHMRVDNAVNDHQKLETAVEVKLDRFTDKLEKIYDLLIKQPINTKG
jgi:hypothetical protein